MSTDPIPSCVIDLLREHVATFEQLEILLLLHGRADVRWNADAIGRHLNIAPEIASQALDELWANRLIVIEPADPQPTCRYTAGAELAPSVDALARIFHDQRASILRILSANAVERVRSGAVRAFADSFVAKKGDSDG